MTKIKNLKPQFIIMVLCTILFACSESVDPEYQTEILTSEAELTLNGENVKRKVLVQVTKDLNGEPLKAEISGVVLDGEAMIPSGKNEWSLKKIERIVSANVNAFDLGGSAEIQNANEDCSQSVQLIGNLNCGTIQTWETCYSTETVYDPDFGGYVMQTTITTTMVDSFTVGDCWPIILPGGF